MVKNVKICQYLPISMVVFLTTKTLENFLSYDLTGKGTRKQACRYDLTEDAPVVDREETYCYNERNKRHIYSGG